MNTLNRKLPISRPEVIAVACLLAAATSLRAAQDKKVTVKDKVYSAAQAAKGEKQYTQVCVTCHDPAKVAPGKKAAPPLIGPKFLDEWADRTLGELMTKIVTTMPDDGSAVLTDADGAALVAYILKQNGFPDGPNDLKTGDASKDIVIVK